MLFCVVQGTSTQASTPSAEWEAQLDELRAENERMILANKSLREQVELSNKTKIKLEKKLLALKFEVRIAAHR
jgi:hypothetical protein